MRTRLTHASFGAPALFSLHARGALREAKAKVLGAQRAQSLCPSHIRGSSSGAPHSGFSSAEKQLGDTSLGVRYMKRGGRQSLSGGSAHPTPHQLLV